MSPQDILLGIQTGLAQGGSGPLIVAAGIVLILFVLAGVALYLTYAYSPRGRLDALLDSRSRSRRNPWPLRIALVVVLIALPLGLDYYVSRPSTCANCHSTKQSVQLKKGAHAKLECMECHGSPGVIGPANNQISYARWSWAYFVEGRRTSNPALLTAIRPEQCLRCHASVLHGVSESAGIRVRHSDFLKAGASCEGCHGDVSHLKPESAKSPSMNGCLPCHDGKQAPSECTTCHIQDISQSQSTQNKMKTTKIKISGDSDVCYKCHEPKPCLQCHGIMMPHPPGWGPSGVASSTAGTHPMRGFTEREMCFRCHFAPGQPFVGSNESCTCHGYLGTMHGGPVWVKEHGLEASGQKPGQLADCGICHVVPSFCEYCHPASIMERYAPVVGMDNYTRTLQPTPAEQATINGL